MFGVLRPGWIAGALVALVLAIAQQALATAECEQDSDCTDYSDSCNVGVCNVDESDPGNSVCRSEPRDFGTMCDAGSDATENLCDAPDTCDGAGTCVDNVADTSVVCRESTDDICDPPEFCDGLSPACPDDDFAAPGTSCDGDINGMCDAPNSCDGAGECIDNVVETGTRCREGSDDICDPPEFCDGLSPACPDDDFAAAGTSCVGDINGMCDAPNTCDGAGECVDNVVEIGTQCRAGTDESCDPAEVCDGENVECPNDQKAEPGTPCGVLSDGLCDAQDTCNDAGECVEKVADTSTLCRESKNEVCDPAERCDGNSAECPADETAEAGTSCGEDGTCDEAGMCIEPPPMPALGANALALLGIGMLLALSVVANRRDLRG